MKLPTGHNLIRTEDGSYTFFSEAFQEACHSTTGAVSETLLHYVNGCKVVERSQEKNPFVILEVGFGLGIGFLTTLKEMPSDRRWEFYSLEIDRGLLDWFKESHSEHPYLKNLRWEKNLLICENQNIKLCIIQGDARKTLPDFLESFSIKWNAVYQDAFSPKRNPTLWTKEWFQLLKLHSRPDVILSTYSASSSIRKSMAEGGWKIHRGDMFGEKKTSTRADLTTPTDEDILFQMDRSPVSALTDLNILAIKGLIKA